MTEFAGIVGGWLMPMFDERGPILPSAWSMAIAIACCLATAYVVHRTLDMGPLVTGTANWRYRSRALRERIARTLTWLVPVRRTRGWWLTRLEFAVALAAIGAAAAMSYYLLTYGPTFGDTPPSPVFALGGLAAMLLGLAWMIRIYRAPLRLDSKAYWRYRDGA